MFADHLLKTKKENRNKKTGYSRYLYQNKLDNACFQHDMWLIVILMIYLDQLLIKYYMIKHLILPQIQNIMDIRGLASMFCKFFDEKSETFGCFQRDVCDTGTQKSDFCLKNNWCVWCTISVTFRVVIFWSKVLWRRVYQTYNFYVKEWTI